MWLFQGNPRRFDVDDYIARYEYVYWSVNRFLDQIAYGDSCVIWRSQPDSGVIAVGRIEETARPADEVSRREFLGHDFWREDEGHESGIKVGIRIEERRLNFEEDFVSRKVFQSNQILNQSAIIKNAQGTVFKLNAQEESEFLVLWRGQGNFGSESDNEAIEGKRRERRHYARERCKVIIDRKKSDFSNHHDGKVFCEICSFDFTDKYPETLANQFIEVHHLSPLADSDEPRRTTLDDLLLVCSNCHRMIHRTKDAENNLQLLKRHFDESAEQSN